MKEENKVIEELNGGMELIKLIYEEVKKNREEFNEKFIRLEQKIDANYKELEEKINANFKYLGEKINANFKYLDEKIDNTKNVLVAEIAEEFKIFSSMTTKSISNLDKKIDNEIEDRKVDVAKVKDFNRIILNDIRSRVSILEEESEKYNPN